MSCLKLTVKFRHESMRVDKTQISCNCINGTTIQKIHPKQSVFNLISCILQWDKYLNSSKNLKNLMPVNHHWMDNEL